MPVQDLQKLEDLCRAYRITFDGELDPSKWPAKHRETLKKTQALGDMKYATYATNSGAEEEFWKLELKNLALTLMEKAHRCRNRNEWNWRLAVEPLIFSRMSSEVCCRVCRKRLWRSEIEATRQDPSEGPAELDSRQRARQPCRCDRTTRSEDLHEASGLNQIFTYRIDEEVHHSEDITRKLGKKEKPDRIFGLRQTRNIENLLYDEARGVFQNTMSQVARQVHELIELRNPLQLTGDRLIFPFMVLEAKSGSSGDSWGSIQMQTAFSIRSFIEAQERLRKAANIPSNSQPGSMVWFIANRGEDWRISLCYPETVSPKPGTLGVTEYRVIDVWQRSILSRDGALQLLLLIDYIFDWARDVFRNAIIRALRILATGNNDAATDRCLDSDIFSTIQTDYLGDQHNLPELSETEATISSMGAYEAVDSPHVAFRHAAFAELSFRCLLITKDSVRTLLSSLPSLERQRTCTLILRELAGAMLMTAEDFDAVEEKWTGTRHATRDRHQTQSNYYTVMSIATYFSAQWHILRDLSVIALEVDAWDDIVLGSGRSRGSRVPKPLVSAPTDKMVFLSNLELIKAGNPRKILLSAINREYIKILPDPTGNIFGTITSIPHPSVWTIVVFIYHSFRRGITGPREPFIRVSKTIHRNPRRRRETNALVDNYAQAYVSSEGCILIDGPCDLHDSRKSKSQICAYLTEGNGQRPEVRDLANMLKGAFETRDFYHTIRDHESPASHLIFSSSHGGGATWNLQNTYGVFTTGFQVLHYLTNIRWDPPLTQGSSRSLSASGTQIFKRNLTPWRSPSHDNMDRESQLFILYKIISREISHWRSVARYRKSKGLPCCEYCATLGSDDICHDCQAFLHDSSRYTWMKDCLVGIEPFGFSRPSPYDLSLRLLGSRVRDICLSEDEVYGRDGKLVICDEDWAWSLDFYGPLNEPFDDIKQLSFQWGNFINFCQENTLQQVLPR